MKFAPFVVLFFLSAMNVFSMGNGQAASKPASNPSQLEQTSGRAEQVMKALLTAYPNQIERLEFRNDDWAVLLRGTWFYFADGRMLPENLLGSAANINPQPFYNYQKDLPAWKEPSPEEAARYRTMASNRNQNPLRRSPHFFDTLWRINNHDEAYQRVKTIHFLGRPVNVHYLIMENLALVEERILAAAKADPQVQTWINNINTLEGWTWRDIAQTQSRSFHAYGLAVDLLPKSLGGRETYWLWAAQKKPDWWNISYNERYHPPAEVIKAFETYGFIWGGKWLYFDTMHFEYRPEILILGGMPPEMRR
ncbi:MAG: M15 family metallopeptidase [Treponema sp.]|jgi:hypothetical protein|nr:M15 family metallopeptidase [Treponema sp.]